MYAEIILTGPRDQLEAFRQQQLAASRARVERLSEDSYASHLEEHYLTHLLSGDHWEGPEDAITLTLEYDGDPETLGSAVGRLEGEAEQEGIPAQAWYLSADDDYE